MNGESQEQRSETGDFQLRRVTRMIALPLAAMGGASLVLSTKCSEDAWTACYFFNGHDLFMVMLLASTLFALSLWVPRKVAPLFMGRRLALWAALLCVGVFICGAIGTDAVFSGFNLSRDEVMSVFDSTVFRSGRLFSSVPTEWRDFESALQPLFMVPITGGEHVISAYMPINAALRALFSYVADPRFLNPLLAAVAVAMVYDLARLLWPHRPDAALVAALLLATSSQLLITSMTSYAMTAHLIFNLLWLRCFLRGGKAGHAGALMLGFLACGLHQVVFHPLFAAPFVLRLLARKSGSLGVFYVFSYLLMVVFWGSYLRMAVLWDGHETSTGDQTADVGLAYLIARVLSMLMEFNVGGVGLIVLNMLRFVTWQNLLLLPLCVMSWRAVRNDESVMRELAAGIALTLLAMFVLLPNQGLGWGYRYWHGLLGSFCLLGACGWIRATQSASSSVVPRGPGGALAAACVFSLLIMLPLNARHAQAITTPTMAARRAIAAAPVDIVLVDGEGIRLGIDLVRNDSALENRPITLYLLAIEPEQLEMLCAHYQLALFGHEHIARFGLLEVPEFTPIRTRRLREKLSSLNCAPLLK